MLFWHFFFFFLAGKMFALIAIVENIAALISSAIYGYAVYPATVEVFAGFSFLLEAILHTVTLAISM